ncbi:hypothetical protein FGO68_gene4018 [Halteria grandinella]|uniref:Uncharacterized protein n=1 Tax=Halteria grandinella TaxID=5974 RepID=A0A8J8NKS7_HALGN|nr:hypothetical protein FGO68_gene4018 [Halteria grandinella]
MNQNITIKYQIKNKKKRAHAAQPFQIQPEIPIQQESQYWTVIETEGVKEYIPVSQQIRLSATNCDQLLNNQNSDKVKIKVNSFEDALFLLNSLYKPMKELNSNDVLDIYLTYTFLRYYRIQDKNRYLGVKVKNQTIELKFEGNEGEEYFNKNLREQIISSIIQTVPRTTRVPFTNEAVKNNEMQNPNWEYLQDTITSYKTGGHILIITGALAEAMMGAAIGILLFGETEQVRLKLSTIAKAAIVGSVVGVALCGPAGLIAGFFASFAAGMYGGMPIRRKLYDHKVEEVEVKRNEIQFNLISI